MIFRLYSILWFFGLGVPLLYFYTIFNAKKVIKNIINMDAMTCLFMFFLILQVLSTFIYLIFDEIELIRLVGIGNNFFIYFSFVVGYSIGKSKDEISTKHLKEMAYVLSFISLALFVFSYLHQSSFQYNLGFKTIELTYDAFLSFGYLARTSILAPYFNASAMLGFLLFILLLPRFNTSREAQLFFILTLIVAITTGSRSIVTILFVAYPFVFFKSLRLVSVYLIFFCFLILPFFIGFMDYLGGLRESSNDTRMNIYTTSLEVMFESNWFSGIGHKPHIDEFKYPVGSHSTFIGYFVKNGLVFGSIPTLLFIFYLSKTLKSFFLALSDSKYKLYFLHMLMGSLFLVVLWFEDLDSFILNSILFGYYIGSVNEYKEKNNILTW